MAYYSKYTGAELEERLDKVEEIPQLIAQMITGKDFVTKEDLLCVLKDYAPADYRTIPIDNNTIYWENGVLKAATSEGGQCQWELREHNGIQYLYSRLPVVTQYDVTMYADVNHLDLPSIYDGLPIDGDTIYWEITEDGRVLKAKSTGGSGGSEDVDANWVVSVITNAGFATQTWVRNALSDYVNITDYQEITGVKNFLNGLQIAGLPITKLNGYEDVIYIDANVVVRGGLTMYSTGEADIPSLTNSIVTDGITILNDNGVLKINPDIQLGGITEEEMQAIVNLINTKWTTDNTKISHWDTAYSWGNHANAGYVTKQYVDDTFVTFEKDEIITGLKTFTKGIQIGNSKININQLQDDILYIDSNVVIRGGLTMYYEDGEIDLPTIKDEIGPAGYDGATGLASFDSSQFSISNDGTVTIIGGSTGLDTAQLKEYLDSNKYTTETWVRAQSYASASSLSSLQTKVDNFLEGSDTDTIINKWKELEVFLSGLSESDNLADILSTKWTTDNNLINQWNTAYGWGDHSKVGYALKSYVDTYFVTLGTKQTITGEKNFTGGLKVNGSPIYYDATNKYWKLEGDLLVTGGVTMYGADGTDFGTIYDGLPIDGTTIYWSNGVLKASSSGSTTKYPLSWSGFNQGSYDGSVAQSFYIPTKLSEFVNDKSFATTSDLSGYLPLRGGTLNGQLNVKGRVIIDRNALQFMNPDGFLSSRLLMPYAGHDYDLSFSIGDNWYRVWHSGNDGAGSGLDADLLDGLDSSVFARQEYNNNFIASGNEFNFVPSGFTPNLWINYRTKGGLNGNIKNYYFGDGAGSTDNVTLNATTFTGNSASATKLKTARNIWGQSFDGTGNVDGTLHITRVNNVEGSYDEGIRINSIGGYSSIWLNTANRQGYDAGMWGITAIKGSNLRFRGGASTLSDLMNITQSGNVLIGTTTDSGYKLDVNGNVQFGTGGSCDIWLNRTSYLSYIHARHSMAFTVNSDGVDTKVLEFRTDKNAYFSNQLHINGIPIYKSQDDVLYIDGNLVVRGGVTMYAENEVDIPSIIDSLPIANANTQDKASKGIASFDSAYFKVTDGWVTLTSAPSSISTIGSLQDVSSSVSGTTNSDVVLFKSANSNTWTTKPLSEIGGGSSGGGSVSGNYLPLSGGTITGGFGALSIKVNNNYGQCIKFENNSSTMGYLGFNSNNKAIIYEGSDISGSSYDIIHEGNISSYNAGSATKLQTARTIWGQSFDGTGNITAPPKVYKDKSSYIAFYSANGSTYYGDIGFSNGSPAIWTSTLKWKTLLHEGNYSSYALPLSGGTLDGALTVYGKKEWSIYAETSASNVCASHIGGYGMYIGTSSSSSSVYALRVGGSLTGASNIFFTVNANGNVGIGTTNPQNKLDVNGYVEANSFILDGYGAQTFTIGVVGVDAGGLYLEGPLYDNTATQKLPITITWRGGFNNQGGIKLDASANMLVTGGITMYSDKRKKTILNHVELSLKQIADAPLIEHYYNSDQNKTTHVGSIAQYWASLNDWFCKLDNEGFYTMEIQNCALASAISIARHLEKYESKTDKKIRMLKKRVQELEDEVERLKNN